MKQAPKKVEEKEPSDARGRDIDFPSDEAADEANNVTDIDDSLRAVEIDVNELKLSVEESLRSSSMNIKDIRKP
jgi:hypothetical protein